jgi:hypothetical protein
VKAVGCPTRHHSTNALLFSLTYEEFASREVNSK